VHGLSLARVLHEGFGIQGQAGNKPSGQIYRASPGGVKCMDVFHNPVTLRYLKPLDPGSKACRDDRHMDSIYHALKRLSVAVKQPVDFQSIFIEFLKKQNLRHQKTTIRLRPY